MRVERLQALADGVFAIALTLLVLELPVPLHSSHLGPDLLRQWPFYAAYVVSFVTVAIVRLSADYAARAPSARSHLGRRHHLHLAPRPGGRRRSLAVAGTSPTAPATDGGEAVGGRVRGCPHSGYWSGQHPIPPLED